ncbi:malonyl CoA-acyl carrier protein transacylase, mitochondrial [Monosporozyma unispora]|nr:[acyl-carrier-protein] S-malonyltransferase [Kazachstania unispora]
MRLLTFPGQGTSISIPVLKALIRNKQTEFNKIIANNGPKTNELINYIFRNPASPGSIAVCSNLFYQLYNLLERQDLKKRSQDYLLLGHSLGELTCLSINELFTLRDLFNIANYRNELMVKYTEKYLIAHRMNHSTKFEMWALSSARTNNLPLQLHNLLQQMRSMAPTIAIANVNSIKQCVVTGLVEDLEKLRIESQTRFPALRITELTNPNNIAFHNNNVLRPIQEPLYDYIWDILKLNHQNTTTELIYPIIGNLDGRISMLVHHAIERFVRCSSNTVQFTSCYDTINSFVPRERNKGKTNVSISMGPGNVIYNLVRRNVDMESFEYSSLATIEEYHKAHELPKKTTTTTTTTDNDNDTTTTTTPSNEDESNELPQDKI